MANNPYVNKVVYGSQVIIDITDTTAVAGDVAQGKYFYDASGAKVEGTNTGGGMIVVETQDEHGGTIVSITGDPVVLQTKSATPTEESQIIRPDNGYTGLSQVNVGAISSTYVGSDIPERDSTDLSVSGPTISVPAGYYADDASKSISNGSATTPATSITANPTISVNSSTGLITATSSASKGITPTVNAGYISSGTFGTVTVSGSNTSQLSTQAGTTINPTESEQTAVSAGKYTLGAVKIGAISSTYVGSGITRRDETDLTVSGRTVTVPSGYYAEQETKSIANGSASTPATTITSNPSISVSSSGLITASVSKTQNVTPTVSAGYVSSGTAGTITVSGSNTQQLTTKAATTITPSKSSQQAVASGVYTTGAITVAAIPAAYQDVTGVTATASDVVSGKDIVNSSGTVVHGSLVIQHYYTGSGTPSSSQGVDGDIYLKTS